MLTSLAGLTLARTIPADCLLGVLSGAYQVFGGVIRNQSGQIVAHLVNAGSAAASMSPPGMLVGVASQLVGNVQLYALGKDLHDLKAATARLVTLSQGTMALSGLTLAVSAAGFLFLSRKLSQIDNKLNEVAKDVKSIKLFLQSQERAALATALRSLSGLPQDLDDRTRIPLLLSARQTLGEIHQRYREQLTTVDRIDDVFGVEEYFTTTALAYSLCSAELDMHELAVTDLEEAYGIWKQQAKRITAKLFFGSEPERLLTATYAPHVRSEEIVSWLDFAHETDKGIGWIDELRTRLSSFRFAPVWGNSPEQKGSELVRKLVARDAIYQGYLTQHRYHASIKVRPSAVQAYIGGLDPEFRIGDCFLFVSTEALSRNG